MKAAIVTIFFLWFSSALSLDLENLNDENFKPCLTKLNLDKVEDRDITNDELNELLVCVLKMNSASNICVITNFDSALNQCFVGTEIRLKISHLFGKKLLIKCTDMNPDGTLDFRKVIAKGDKEHNLSFKELFIEAYVRCRDRTNTKLLKCMQKSIHESVDDNLLMRWLNLIDIGIRGATYNPTQ